MLNLPGVVFEAKAGCPDLNPQATGVPGGTKYNLCFSCHAGVLRQELLRSRVTDDDRDVEVHVQRGHKPEHPAALHQLR